MATRLWATYVFCNLACGLLLGVALFLRTDGKEPVTAPRGPEKCSSRVRRRAVTLQEPTKPEDVIPAFERIGEDGWDVEIRRVLEDYGVPMPAPSNESELRAAEARIGHVLPRELVDFHTALGAIDFDGIQILPPHKIALLGSEWHDLLAGRHRVLIVIAETDEPIVWNPDTGFCQIVRHDPPGLECNLTVSELIRYAIICLASGYYGWPDLDAMTDAAAKQLFGDRLE